MVDIAMCSGDGCDVRGNCYRHVAKPGEWQVWFNSPPRDEKSCLWIIFVEKGETDVA